MDLAALGREISQGDLVTSFGPQFKALPAMVTTILSPLGDSAITLWIFIARVLGLLAVAGAARLAWRVAGPVAAAIAALALISLHTFTFYLLAYGMSEPMLIALAFWAIDRALAGRRSAAIVLITGAAFCGLNRGLSCLATRLSSTGGGRSDRFRWRASCFWCRRPGFCPNGGARGIHFGPVTAECFPAAH